MHSAQGGTGRLAVPATALSCTVNPEKPKTPPKALRLVLGGMATNTTAGDPLTGPLHPN